MEEQRQGEGGWRANRLVRSEFLPGIWASGWVAHAAAVCGLRDGHPIYIEGWQTDAK